MTKDDRELLIDAGWVLVDLRSLGSQDFASRTQAVLATLEALRLGCVELSREDLRGLELEARICGLVSSKGVSDEKPKMDDEDMDQVLAFGKEA